MTVSQPGVVDTVIRSDDGGSYTLLMVEDRLFDGSADQVDEFVYKVNAYLMFVQSGQFYDRTPDARDKPLAVCLVCRDEPTDAALVDALRAATQLFSRSGIAFTVQIIPAELLPPR